MKCDVSAIGVKTRSRDLGASGKDVGGTPETHEVAKLTAEVS
jgi:hypothetical protein